MARNYDRDIKPILDEYFDLTHLHEITDDRITYDTVTLRRPIGPYSAGLQLRVLDVYNRGPLPPRPANWPSYLPWEPRPNRLEVIGYIPGSNGSKRTDFTPYLPL